MEKLEDSLHTKHLRHLLHIESPTLYNLHSHHLNLYLPLVLAGQKPGLTFSIEKNKLNQTKYCLDNIDVHYRHGEIESQQYVIFYVSNSKKYLNQLEIGYEDNTYEFSKILGIPEKDINWINEKEGEISNYTPIPEYLNLDEERWDDLFYAKLVSWICRPEEEALRRTIRIGKEWYDTLRTIDNEYNITTPLIEANKQMHIYPTGWYDWD